MSQDTHPDIPGYRIIRKLGEGGMALVYLAIQESFDREVALKILSGSLSRDQDYCKRFMREARIIGKLNSPHIVPVYEVGNHGDIYYLSMEYMPAGSLSTRIPAGIDPDTALDIIKQVAAGLQCAHSHNSEFIHRDVKPDNILFRNNDSVVLGDFGIAKSEDMAEAATALTSMDTIIGSPKYMSPEQARGEKLDARTDLYNLGIVLYEMLVKSPPYTGPNPVSIILKQQTAPVPELPSNLSYLQPLLSKALAKLPSERFQSAAEFIKAVESIQNNRTVKITNSDATGSRKLGVTSAAILSLAVLGIGAIIYYSNTKQSGDGSVISTPSVPAPDSTPASPPTKAPEVPSARVFYSYLDALESAIPDVSRSFIAAHPDSPLSEILRVYVLNDISRIASLETQTNETSLLVMSELYDNGWGVEKDAARAISLAEQAAALGSPLSKVQLANLLLAGNPSDTDISRVIQLLDDAAGEDFYLALNNRGILYINGTGGEKNTERGMEYLKRAATLGDRDAMFTLGKIYENGMENIPSDKDWSQKYFEAAAELGDQRAVSHLE